MGLHQVSRQQLVISIFSDFIKKGYEPDHRGLPELIRSEAEKQLRDKNDPHPELAQRTVQDWVKRAREALARAQEAQEVNLDAPWSMATLTKKECELPANAVPAVLRVWRYCLAIESRFSIRQARWVARLQSIITDTTMLWDWAAHYSDQERICEMLGQPFDSPGLDAALVMTDWQLATARWIGSVTWLRAEIEASLSSPAPQEFQDLSSRIAASIAEGLMWTEVIHLHFEAVRKDEEAHPRPGKVMREPPHLDHLNLPQEAEWIYAHWLIYLRKGPKWHSLSPEENLGMIKQLREWIQDHPWAKDTKNIPPMLLFMDDQELVALPDFKPTKLLQEVGYEL